MKFTMWNQISDRLNWYWYFRADYYCYFILLLSTNNPWTTLIFKSHLLIGFLDGSEQRWGFDRCWRNLLQIILTFHFSVQTKYFFSLAIFSYCLQYLSPTYDGLNSLVEQQPLRRLDYCSFCCMLVGVIPCHVFGCFCRGFCLHLCSYSVYKKNDKCLV